MQSVSAELALARLLQLSSVSLPVGGFAFSQGLEHAVEIGWVNSSDAVAEWISLQLIENNARVDLPVLRLVMQAFSENDFPRCAALNDLLLASRETKELRLSDTAMGEALLRLMKSLDLDMRFLEAFYIQGSRQPELSFVCLFGICAQQWQIPYAQTAMGLLWSWLENQVAAATKLVPLGQTQAQRLLQHFQPHLSEVIQLAEQIDEQHIGGSLPALAITSAQHETQYSRLFRS